MFFVICFIKAIIGTIFSNKRGAYSMYSLSQSLTNSIGFFYSSYLSVRYKVYLIICVASLSLISYLILEIKIYRNNKKCEVNNCDTVVQVST